MTMQVRPTYKLGYVGGFLNRVSRSLSETFPYADVYIMGDHVDDISATATSVFMVRVASTTRGIHKGYYATELDVSLVSKAQQDDNNLLIPTYPAVEAQRLFAWGMRVFGEHLIADAQEWVDGGGSLTPLDAVPNHYFLLGTPDIVEGGLFNPELGGVVYSLRATVHIKDDDLFQPVAPAGIIVRRVSVDSADFGPLAFAERVADTTLAADMAGLIDAGTGYYSDDLMASVMVYHTFIAENAQRLSAGAGFHLVIEDEVMDFVNIGGATALAVRRASSGSVAVAHASGTPIYLYEVT